VRNREVRRGSIQILKGVERSLKSYRNDATTLGKKKGNDHEDEVNDEVKACL